MLSEKIHALIDLLTEEGLSPSDQVRLVELVTEVGGEVYETVLRDVIAMTISDRVVREEFDRLGAANALVVTGIEDPEIEAFHDDVFAFSLCRIRLRYTIANAFIKARRDVPIPA